MPFKKGFFFISIFLIQFSASAQFFDSIFIAVKSKPTLDLRIDSRTSFISTSPARITGFKLGFVFDKKLKIGIGYNWLTSSLLKTNSYINENGTKINVLNKLKLSYISPYIEYTYYNSNKIELSIPMLFGFGKAFYSPLNTAFNLSKYTPRSGLLMMYEPYSIGVYKITPWFGLGLGIGYRVVLVGNKTIDENINSPVYVFKAKIYSNELLKIFK